MQVGRSAESISDLAFFSIDPKAVVTSLQSQVADVIDFQLKRYLQDRCVGGKSTLHRLGEHSAIMFSLLLVLPVLSFLVCALVPMESPLSGFWEVQFLGPSCLNYVVARGQLQCMSRAFGREDRSSARWIVRITPLADSVFCLLAHLIASFAGVYPIPVAPAFSCAPCLWCSMALLATASTGDAHAGGPPVYGIQLRQLGLVARTVRHSGALDGTVSHHVSALSSTKRLRSPFPNLPPRMAYTEMRGLLGNLQVSTKRDEAVHVLHQPLLLCDFDVEDEEHRGGSRHHRAGRRQGSRHRGEAAMGSCSGP